MEASARVVLPMQILVEVHYRTQMKGLFRTASVDWKNETDFIELQAHLLRMGYSVAIRDDNPHCRHCTELSLLRHKCNNQFGVSSETVSEPLISSGSSNLPVVSQTSIVGGAEPNQVHPVASSNTALCANNPYVNSLKTGTSLASIDSMANQWLSNKHIHQKELWDVSQGQHNHARFGAFEEMAPCEQTCTGPCTSDTSKRVCGLSDLKESCIVYSVGG